MRTHALRPPDDAWILALTAPRVQRQVARRRDQREPDARTLARCGHWRRRSRRLEACLFEKVARDDESRAFEAFLGHPVEGQSLLS